MDFKQEARLCNFSQWRYPSFKFISLFISGSLNLCSLLKFRVNVFAHVLEGFRLSGAAIAIVQSESRTRCISYCVVHPLCLSVNFCNRTDCELNQEDFWTSQQNYSDNLDVLTESGCVYSGMESETLPFCEEGGNAKSIVDDSPGVCEINKKRRDGIGTYAHVIAVDSETGTVLFFF